MNEDDDKNLFRKLYGDIERIDHDKQVHGKKRVRRHTARSTGEPSRNPFRLVPYPDTDESVVGEIPDTFRGNGVQNSVMQKLKRGKLEPESTLDLHGKTREEALDNLQEFIMESMQQGMRCVLIIHGKGYRSSAGKPVLKPAVSHWLKQIEAVLAYCPALPEHGGDGARYVLLRRLREKY